MEGFFRELSQQPLGPLVLDSVSTFLDRVEGLEDSKQPGAKEVLSTLRARGLTEAVFSDMRQKVSRARSGLPGRRRAVDPAEHRSALETQQQALRDLRLAWNDWATSLRPLYDVREQIHLGLTDIKLRAESTPEPAQAPTGTDSAGT
jgi:hypothetical protein